MNSASAFSDASPHAPGTAERAIDLAAKGIIAAGVEVLNGETSEIELLHYSSNLITFISVLYDLPVDSVKKLLSDHTSVLLGV